MTGQRLEQQTGLKYKLNLMRGWGAGGTTGGDNESGKQEGGWEEHWGDAVQVWRGRTLEKPQKSSNMMWRMINRPQHV